VKARICIICDIFWSRDALTMHNRSAATQAVPDAVIAMCELFARLLKNADGFTAVEYGILTGLMVIAVEQLTTKF